MATYWLWKGLCYQAISSVFKYKLGLKGSSKSSEVLHIALALFLSLSLPPSPSLSVYWTITRYFARPTMMIDVARISKQILEFQEIWGNNWHIHKEWIRGSLSLPQHKSLGTRLARRLNVTNPSLWEVCLTQRKNKLSFTPTVGHCLLSSGQSFPSHKPSIC